MRARAVALVLVSAVLGCGVATTPEDAGTDASPTVCRHASDCVDGFVCVAQTCQPVVSCTTSRMCPGLLCNPATGTCVECVTSRDCVGDAQCRSGVCEGSVACATDRDCTSMDSVCSLDEMRCVECNNDADCVAPRSCAPDHSCATATCAAVEGCDAGVVDGGFDGDVEIDGGTDAGVDSAVPADDSGVAPMWELLSSGMWPLYGGFTDYVPSGESSFYAMAASGAPSFSRYAITTHSWTTLPSPPSTGNDGLLAGPAWVGGSLYVMFGMHALRYEIAGAAWTTLTSVAMSSQSQNAHDDTGHVYAVASDGRVVTYDIAANTVAYQAFTAGPIAIPRVAWDPPSARLYIAPTLEAASLSVFDPVTGSVAPLAAIPGATTFAPAFCGDRAGHLYGTTSTVGDTMFWRYDIPTNTWSAMPPLPFAHNQNGQCTVSADGYLYLSADQPSLARIRIR